MGYRRLIRASFFVFRKSGGALRAVATLIDDILGLAKPDVSLKARRFPERRFGKLKVRELSFSHAGVEIAQENYSSAKLTQEKFTKNMKSPPYSFEAVGGSGGVPVSG